MEELIQDPATPSFRIDVSTTQGIVSLSGDVNNIMAKERAERIAETVKGVRSVVNRITVSAPLRTDTEIRRDVDQALIDDRATDSFEIDVAVADQVVTLTGDVDSWQEKELAGKVAKSVRGVKGLKNDLTVSYGELRTDAAMKAEIEESLRWNNLVDDGLISVAVDDGKVTLTGTVGSAAEKGQATYDAYVQGVSIVNTDDLTVARWARDDDLRRDKYVDRSDKEVRKAVEDALLYDPRANSYQIGVTVDDGTATLTGTVDTVAAKRAAARDARNTVGVWRVKNQIRVRAASDDDALTDAELESRIRSAFLRDPQIDRFDLTVSVNDGRAMLSGTTDTYLEKMQAEDVASRLAGVESVSNFILVNNGYDPIGYDPYLDDTYIYDYDWYHAPVTTTTSRDDWAIRDDIESELFWSPFVDADEVTVTVNRGQATLTGTVDTWSEREAAGENALEGGAVSVENKLSVDYGPDYFLNGT